MSENNYQKVSMFFGINVWHTTYQMDAPCYLIPFFSNICVHLEKYKKGTRFPYIMNEFYEGILYYEHVLKAIEELDQISIELKEVPFSKYVYDFEEPGKSIPEGMKQNGNAPSIYAALTDKNGEEMLPLIRRAFTEALYFKENVWIGNAVMDVENQKKPYTEEEVEHFVFLEGREGLILDRYFGTKKCVVVPEIRDGIPVTVIGEKAFSDNQRAEEIILPESVTELCAESFYGCRNLKSITLGSCIEKIGKEAFCGCSSLLQIDLPYRLKVISEKMFDTCFALTDMVIPDSIEVIEQEAFSDCRKLTSITIPASVKVISTLAFKKTKKHLTIVSPSGSVAAKYAKKYKLTWHE